jgi:DNA-binding Lrp family transcriptional regulator
VCFRLDDDRGSGTLDQQLAQCLAADGRASFSAIAEVMGVSDQTVARRYQRLRCVPGAGEAIAAALARRPDTAWVQLLSGDTSRLHIFTGDPDAAGVVDVLPAERVAPLRFPACTVPPDGPAVVTELDRALFAALAVDDRTGYADLAGATGWSESTVRRRVEQLRGTGQLYFKLELDMPAFGFRNATWLWLSVPPAYIAETGTALAKFPEVAYATATTGPANLAACAVCRDEESLYEFLTRKVGALPGVERVETSPVIRTVKQASPVMVPRP